MKLKDVKCEYVIKNGDCIPTEDLKCDWDTLTDKQKKGWHTTRLELAKQKLERLNREFQDKQDAVFGHAKLTNGQPMNDKRGGYTFIGKQEKLEEALFNKLHEIKKQEEYIEELEEREYKKRSGLNRSGNGLALTIDNIDRIREEVEAHERGEGWYSKATVKKYKEKLKEFEMFKSQKISDKAQQLIDSGKINQWKKQPTIYFVKGMRKVAVELNSDGNFEICKRYVLSEEDKRKVLELIN